MGGGAANVGAYDPLHLQITDASNYDEPGRWVTEVSALNLDSDSQPTNQAIC